MSNFLPALIPVIFLVALGRGLAHYSVIQSEGWRGIERLVYFVLFPVLIVSALAKAEFTNFPWGMAVVLIAAQIILGAIGALSAGRKWRGDAPATGSIIQSNVRWNTFIALSIAGALFGEQGLALVAICAAAMIPTANILSVGALTHYASREPGKTPNVLRDLATNPLIIACLIGIGLNVAKLPPTGIIDVTMDLLGRATIALGLLAAGAGVNFALLRTTGGRTLIWSTIRLLGLPGLVLGLGLLLGLPQTHLIVAVICAATPTATNGYILAQQLGGDAPLSANLIALQTVLAALTMPLVYTLTVLAT